MKDTGTDQKVLDLEKEIASLRERVAELESQLDAKSGHPESGPVEKETNVDQILQANGLTNAEIKRFSRQLLIPEIAVEGQVALKNASVLIVGAGGLGSPSSLYLSAMGIGRIGLIDHDVVDISNIHRQVIHTESRVGVSKVESARNVNSLCKIDIYDTLLDSANAMEIVSGYDVVVDASDNPATRYLINDACVLLNKPLVSGSAVRLDGQLTTYNYNGGPCYRCMFPKPPPSNAVMNCSETGVLGIGMSSMIHNTIPFGNFNVFSKESNKKTIILVPGIIGCLEALEVVKIVTGSKANEPPNMLLFSYKSYPHFRNVKIRSRRKDCVVCGDSPTISELIDYPQFCGSGYNDKPTQWKILDGRSSQVTCREYGKIKAGRIPHVLIDVRDEAEFKIVSLPGSINIPLKNLSEDSPEIRNILTGDPVYTICKRGNYSQMAVVKLKEVYGVRDCFNIIGGLDGWSSEIDSTIPSY
ncbi:hypothetical protein H4219_003188 [Mycoemilia scoparia]|uniref:Rhodanese domain-containing protein n=1 Tax=Mycoemilia scoparia TaxID=417184 RepID=A0A9W8DT05_9FUNG|nr:hypothetical protein H4219_003188 [Mycoemilia scoparia]